ncbi:reductase [Solimonas fluminis]|uniref:Reductase n=1 Tax=Solimonas fluminis TaxID=2086571 RepID=A0A2S5TLD3_9GAMM|nr:reductase [Solimonas fluminis]PPE75568.1 reductase [Solimonas fluminis]
MQLDLEKMRDRIKASQWALADIDWDAPGRERVTENPELYAKLKAFMADLMWIEHVGARGFAAMAKKAPNDTLREIYTYFHAEEQRHANAEMALMQRWGMLDGEGLPEPNINIRLVVEWLDAYADEMPLSVLGSVIPMLEITLDGALCKFLLDTVDDPVCHAAFDKINADEARHLGVDFHVLEMLGHGPIYRQTLDMAGRLIDPRLLMGILAYLPLLNRMRDNLVELGLKENKLYEAIAKYKRVGGTPGGRRNPWFQLISRQGAWVIDRKNVFYHAPVDALVRLTGKIPPRLLPQIPSWVHELTWKPTA